MLLHSLILPELMLTISPTQHGLATATIPDTPTLLWSMPQLLLFSVVLTTGLQPPNLPTAASPRELLMISSLLLRHAESTNLSQTADAITICFAIAQFPMLSIGPTMISL